MSMQQKDGMIKTFGGCCFSWSATENYKMKLVTNYVPVFLISYKEIRESPNV